MFLVVLMRIIVFVNMIAQKIVKEFWLNFVSGVSR